MKNEHISNIEEKEEVGAPYHVINMEIKRLCQKCEENSIPIFIAYFLKGRGYKYRSIFPEEIGTESVQSEYGKFKEFLKVCIGFNKNN